MPKERNEDSSHSNSVWLLGCALAAITIVAYFPALGCTYIWDDDDYVTQNEELRDVDGLRQIWFELGEVPQYYPLVHTSYWIEYHIWGLNPVGYHVNNVLLHATSAILLWQLLSRLSVPGAWLAAAIFAVHPICVESVAWITERKNTLSTVFYLSAALTYVRFAGLDNGQPHARRWWFYGLAIVLFFMALLSKTITATFPCAALLVIWWRRGTIRWTDVLWTIPFFLVALPMGLITVLMEKYHVGADTIDWELSLIDRVLIAGRALWFYAGKLLLPTKLTFIYPRWQIDAMVWWQYLFPIGFVVVLVLLWLKREQLGRGPLTAALFFAGTLVPALGFFDVYPMRFSYVADHFQYLASIGLITLAASTFVRRTTSTAMQQYAGAGIIIGLAALTWFQCQIYQDQETLWNDTIAKNNTAWIAHNNLGGIRAARADYPTAIGYFTRAIELKSDYPKAHFNRGRARAAMGDFSSAVDDMTTAIDLAPKMTHRVFWRASIRLAIGTEDQFKHSESDLAKILNKDKNNASATAILARIHLLRGDIPQARGLLSKVESTNPVNVEVLLTRGLVKIQDGQQTDGQGDLLTALRQQQDRKLELARLIEQITASSADSRSP